MTTAMQAYKARGLTNRQSAIGIIQGFQRQLKIWWDNFLSHEERDQLLAHRIVTTNAQGMEVEEEAAA